ncbi:class I SAM-dependent methyltransferase [Curtobacterium sp. VKM Ac-2865]|uniref:class I SAM-dependent methyltransferase n=1 Tax=Curtobacterium sp. VKM Ac-2865 TaxID=2783817 RepID=UPI00188CC035|nr:class I SAM-dependent methyltransferase [Curtobacterium sp. VKM Ac-2865]MBF4583871.1 class I SAM-dependent methyltransferase [Curtobacterium sp. VKM Ac-2865]
MLRSISSWTIRFLLAGVQVTGSLFFWSHLRRTSRGLGISATAYAPLLARARLHLHGVRSDQRSFDLLFSLPGVHTIPLWLMLAPERLAHALSGHVPRSRNEVPAGEATMLTQGRRRPFFYDRICSENVGAIVVIGAGWDSRAAATADAGGAAFEVDLLATQATKQACQARTGTGKVTFIPADADDANWIGDLERGLAGSPGRTVFILEGLLPYLEPAYAAQCVGGLARIARPGDVLAFDFVSRELLELPNAFDRALSSQLRQSVAAAGEPYRFFMDTRDDDAGLDEWLRGLGWRLENTEPWRIRAGGVVVGGMATCTPMHA